MKRLVLAVITAFLVASACEDVMPEPTATLPTQTPAATATAVPTPAPTAIPTPTATPVPTATATATATASPTPTTEPIVAAFARFENAATVKLEGEFAVISSNAVPNHSSPYFFRTDARYQQYNGLNTAYAQNPNAIYAQALVFRIPLKPVKAEVSQPTPLGPIGVSINGVPFFNQYAGPNNRLLTFEINSFDQYNGHPQMTGMYHYHVEPLYLTTICGRDALLGYLLDGFPVYGPMEGGKLVTNADLDASHGHSHTTKEYPDGIYHYHVTLEAPYINGVGFYGKAGSVVAR